MFYKAFDRYSKSWNFVKRHWKSANGYTQQWPFSAIGETVWIKQFSRTELRNAIAPIIFDFHFWNGSKAWRLFCRGFFLNMLTKKKRTRSETRKQTFSLPNPTVYSEDGQPRNILSAPFCSVKNDNFFFRFGDNLADTLTYNSDLGERTVTFTQKLQAFYFLLLALRLF